MVLVFFGPLALVVFVVLLFLPVLRGLLAGQALDSSGVAQGVAVTWWICTGAMARHGLAWILLSPGWALAEEGAAHTNDAWSVERGKVEEGTTASRAGAVPAGPVSLL